MANVIYDGLTRSAYIAAVPRLHDELRFTFRPPTKESIGRFFDGLPKKQSTVAAAKYEAEAVASRLVSWSQLDADGKPLPINHKTVAALQPKLFDRLRDIALYGAEGGDADPEEEAKELASDTADAAEQGLTMAQLREERDVKN